jgi:aspartyl-tRNA(Asn)/glutamyl-tRNA(Gln) amidotransferase subunit A
MAFLIEEKRCTSPTSSAQVKAVTGPTPGMVQPLDALPQHRVPLTSQQMTVPKYSTNLRSKTSSFRLGLAHEFFFESLDPEIEATTSEAISVLEKLTAGVRPVTLPLNNITDRSVIYAEAYAYHAEFAAKMPDLYQPATLAAVRSGADIHTADYIMAHRELLRLRRNNPQVFESVDAIITPTSPIPPPTISAFDTAYKDVPFPADPSDIRRVTLRNTLAFDKYGLPTISVPCGFTRAGLPVGLQTGGPHDGEAVVLQLAHAYEQATEWHKKHPTIS